MNTKYDHINFQELNEASTLTGQVSPASSSPSPTIFPWHLLMRLRNKVIKEQMCRANSPFLQLRQELFQIQLVIGSQFIVYDRENKLVLMIDMMTGSLNSQEKNCIKTFQFKPESLSRDNKTTQVILYGLKICDQNQTRIT